MNSPPIRASARRVAPLFALSLLLTACAGTSEPVPEPVEIRMGIEPEGDFVVFPQVVRSH